MTGPARAVGEVRLRDLAARTGLSPGTVSLALRGYDEVSSETKRAVLEAARELGYDLARVRGPRQRAAEAGSSGRARARRQPVRPGAPSRLLGMPPAAWKHVAIVYGGLLHTESSGQDVAAIESTTTYGAYLRGIQAVARDFLVDLMFLPAVNGDSDPLVGYALGDSGVESPPSSGALSRPDGVILLGLGDETPAVQRALAAPSPRPVVLLGRYETALPCSWVSVDQVEGAALVTSHLLDRGYDRVAFVATRHAEFSWERQRREGYQRALARAGRRPDPTLELLETHPRVDEALVGRAAAMIESGRAAGESVALFVVGDTVALRLREGLARRGLDAPRDYGLAGFDNSSGGPTGQDGDLTTIGYPRERMGAMALRLLREVLDTPGVARQHVVVAPELLVRGSTQRPGSGDPAAGPNPVRA